MDSIYYQSPIGLMQISATPHHIMNVKFVLQELEKTTSGNMLLTTSVSQLQEYFNGSRKKFDLPVMQEGTVFQQSIWKLLREIPFGETVSYLEIAKRFGDQKAVRAVGAANGKNKIPIIVPCHRVIGSNGKLVGFAYGIERKKYLLDLEKKTAQMQLF